MRPTPLFLALLAMQFSSALAQTTYIVPHTSDDAAAFAAALAWAQNMGGHVTIKFQSGNYTFNLPHTDILPYLSAYQGFSLSSGLDSVTIAGSGHVTRPNGVPVSGTILNFNGFDPHNVNA